MIEIPGLPWTSWLAIAATVFTFSAFMGSFKSSTESNTRIGLMILIFLEVVKFAALLST